MRPRSCKLILLYAFMYAPSYAGSGAAAAPSRFKPVPGCALLPCAVTRSLAHPASGQDIRSQNVTACVAIANIVKSTLGPVGLDKMLVRRVFSAYFRCLFPTSRTPPAIFS